MMSIRKQHRVHIPNSLAVFAVVLLLISSVVGFESNQDAGISGQTSIISAKASATGNDSAGNVANKKPSGFKLGSLLFRRG